MIRPRAQSVQLKGRDDLHVDVSRRLAPCAGGVLVSAGDSGVDPDRPLRTLEHIGVAPKLIENPHPRAVC